MKTKKIIFGALVLSTVISACSTMKTSSRCLTYTISGDSGYEWTPTKFYQSESMLFMQLPAYTKYIPTVRVMDNEFGQPYKIDYTFNAKTQQIEVQDNYDEYILTREEYDQLSADKVYIRCNREAPIK